MAPFQIQLFEKLLRVLPTVSLVHFPMFIQLTFLCVSSCNRFIIDDAALYLSDKCSGSANIRSKLSTWLGLNDFFCYFAFPFWLCLCHLKLSSISQKNKQQTNERTNKKITTTLALSLSLACFSCYTDAGVVFFQTMCVFLILGCLNCLSSHAAMAVTR